MSFFGPEFQQLRCCSCDVLFCVTVTLHQQRREDKKSFWCPNGHQQSFVRGAVDDLREELERKKRSLESLSQRAVQLAERAARAEGAAKRSKRALAKLRRESASSGPEIKIAVPR